MHFRLQNIVRYLSFKRIKSLFSTPKSIAITLFGFFIAVLVIIYIGNRLHVYFQSALDPVLSWKFDEGYGIRTSNSTSSTNVTSYLAHASNSFASRSDLTSGTAPFSVAIGDVNADGKKDIVAANATSDNISVFISNGDGTFVSKVNYTTGNSPQSVALGDVNLDGKLDVAVTNAASPYGVSVFINNGDGTFAARVDLPSSTQPYAVAMGDVNGDGYLDIGTANLGTDTISVFINNGNGTFAAKVDYSTGSNSFPDSIAMGDLNGDDKADIVSIDDGTDMEAQVFINNGDGTFTGHVDYAPGAQPAAVALGDIDNDGDLDLAVAQAAGQISVYTNNGAGVFSGRTDNNVGSAPEGVAFGDINGDGYQDIAAANRSSGTVSVLINNGNNTFATKVDYGQAATTVHTVAIDDVNNDLSPDIVAASYDATVVSVLINTARSPVWNTEDKCVTGKCLFFDGSDDYVNIGNSLATLASDTQVTFSGWIKASTLNSSQQIYFESTSTSNTSRFGVSLNSAGKILMNIRDSAADPAGTVFTVTSNTSISLNQWTFITAVFDSVNDSHKIYINGALDKTDTTAKAALGSSRALQKRIGNALTEPFKGYIDDIKVYNYARTETQIKQDYVARGSVHGISAQLGDSGLGQILSNGLVGYWKMDESTWVGSNAVLDSSGNLNSGTAVGNAAITASGKFSNGGTFDGANDSVSIADNDMYSVNTTNKFTASVWFNTNSLASRQSIISKGTTSQFEWDFRVETTGVLNLILYDSAGVTYLSAQSPASAISTGTWYMATMVVDLNKPLIQTYINGQLVGSSTVTTGSYTNGTSALRFGERADGSNDVNGRIDEVRIYNRAFSPKEVSQLYEWAPGPVGYWNFNENVGEIANDISGNGNSGNFQSGTASPSWSDGKFGSAVEFDGTADYLYVIDPASGALDFGTGNFSYTFWMKTTVNSPGGQQLLYKRDAAGGNPGYSVAVLSAKIVTVLDDGVATEVNSTSVSDVNDNKWHYIGVVNDRAGFMYLYIDGVLEDSDIISGSTGTVSNSTNLTFGKSGISAAQFYRGAIDDVHLYNYARTQKQIIEDMNAGHPPVGSPVGSPVAYYKLDEGYGTTANNSGNVGSTLNGTFGTGTSAPTWTNSGKFSKAISFDGSSDYFSVPDNNGLDAPTGFTVSLWANPTKYTGNTQIQGFMLNKGVFPNYNYRLLTDGNSGNRFTVGADIGSTGFVAVTTRNTYLTDTWYNVVGSYNGSQLKIYVNGKLDSSLDVGGTLNTNATDLYIGKYSGGNGYEYKGSLDEVKIYNYGLTDDEVKVEYNRGKSIALGALSTGVGGTSPDNSSSRENCVPGDSSSCSSPVGEWSFNEGNGTSANDTSGNGNTGTLGAGISTPLWTNGKVGKALSFDGTGDVIQVADSSTLDVSNITISAWIKLSSQNNSNHVIVSKWEGAPNRSFIFLVSPTTGKLSLNLSSNGTATNSVIGNISLNTDIWYYVTATYDSSTAQLYVNGVLDNQASISGAIFSSSSKVTIGHNNDPAAGLTQFFTGVMDELKIYDYVRTPAQIAWDYNRGQPVAWYRLDECTGTTAYNAVKDGNDQPAGTNGTITIGASGTQTSAGTCSSGTSTQAWNNGTIGKRNSSLNFDGTDDYITVGDVSLLDFTGLQPFTISAWIKPASTENWEAIVSKMDIGSSGRQYTFSVMVNEALRLRVSENSGGFDFIDAAAPAGTLTLGQWQYVTASYDGGTTPSAIKIYKNGARVDSITASSGTFTGMEDSSTPVYIGRDADAVTSRDFDGQIDDVQIFKYAVTSSQVKVLMNEGAVSFR